MFEEEVVDKVNYKQWVTVDRCALETVEKDVSDFMEVFLENVPKLNKHHFIAKKQNEFFQLVKSVLLPGEVLIIADFSENYRLLFRIVYRACTGTTTSQLCTHLLGTTGHPPKVNRSH